MKRGGDRLKGGSISLCEGGKTALPLPLPFAVECVLVQLGVTQCVLLAEKSND